MLLLTFEVMFDFFSVVITYMLIADMFFIGFVNQMPVCFSWLHLSADSKYTKVERWLTSYHMTVTHSVDFISSQTVVFPGRAYLLNDT